MATSWSSMYETLKKKKKKKNISLGMPRVFMFYPMSTRCCHAYTKYKSTQTKKIMGRTHRVQGTTYTHVHAVHAHNSHFFVPDHIQLGPLKFIFGIVSPAMYCHNFFK
jgi:hypothetical protein